MHITEKSIEHTSGVKPNVNCGVWLMACRHRLTSCSKGKYLMQDVNSGGSRKPYGVGGEHTGVVYTSHFILIKFINF